MSEHPKILAAGHLAELVQYRALQYCARYLTDGFIPMEALSALTRSLPQEIDWAGILVEHGLWTRRKGGYGVHDYLCYNPSKNDLKTLRRQRSRAGQKGALATNARRYTSANAAAHAAANGRQYPIPSPVVASVASFEASEAPTSHPSGEICGHAEAVVARPPSTRHNGFRIPEPVLTALGHAPRLGAVAALRQSDWWQAQVRANPTVDLAREVLKAEAWLRANPERHVKRLPRFLHNWFANANRDAEDEG